ncbi:hypothetical protein HYH03_015650 [Edaphochlamys debaryana]|uniref:Uncharacterized protein n=1 Tax=Edaphochlamys debaryana TaxID=47281 RepID=A0A835XMU9_9CHLO|nr:hypothetical protein HYH03_015650 [Edaphochlamys debaryana]|eukprot:KAG2485678.1 hypothetical protein HYH03_015650 [Edaphochlamys debaryana]
MIAICLYSVLVLALGSSRGALAITTQPWAEAAPADLPDYRRYVQNVPADTAAEVKGRWPDPAANAELSKKYEPILEWFGFSQRYDISQECRAGHKLRWAYFSRSAEATWDFIAISHHLDVPHTILQPRLFYDLVRNTTEATDAYMSTANIAFLKWRGLGHMICHVADILVFGDVTADARPVLQGNCTTPIILHVHTRFTVGVMDMDAYLELMADAATRPWVWFVASNPYELRHLESMGIPLPPSRTLLLRPVGACLLPQPPPVTPQQAFRLAMLANHKQGADGSLVDAWLARTQLVRRVDMLTDPAIHPAVLAQRRGVLHVPFHPAAMLMYAGMAAGTVFVLPSPDFFLQLVADHAVPFCCRSC